MPSLSTLKLELGGEGFRPAIISALSRGPQITALTMTLSRYPELLFLAEETNPWPHLKSVSIKSYTSVFPSECTPPKVQLAQVIVHYTSGGRFEELDWLTRYSKETLTHVSLISESLCISHEALRYSRLKTIQSLTLGEVIWDKEIIGIFNTLSRLKELRLVSGEKAC